MAAGQREVALLLLLVFVRTVVEQELTDPQEQEVTVKRGDNATLQCGGGEGAAIGLFNWTRDDNQVLFCRVDGCVQSFQDPVYRGRAQPVDMKQMKHGDASMVLRNVTFDDAGRFQCHVLEIQQGRSKRHITIRSVIVLKVLKDPVGPGPGPAGGGGAGLIAGLVAAGAVVLAAAAVAVVFVVRGRNNDPQLHSESLGSAH